MVKFDRQQEREARYPALGIVVGNKDQLYMGRVRVAITMMGLGLVTPWIDISAQMGKQ